MKKQEIFKLIGKTFGRLTVMDVVQLPAANNRVIFRLKCICECGNCCFHEVGSIVGNNPTKSCGCLRKEKWRKGYYAWLKEQEGLYK